jgi:hypothetical protein
MLQEQIERAQLDARQAHPKKCPNCGGGLGPGPQGDIRCLECDAADAALQKRLADAQHLLARLRGWDVMDATADGPYWRSEIDKALAN